MSNIADIHVWFGDKLHVFLVSCHLPTKPVTAWFQSICPNKITNIVVVYRVATIVENVLMSWYGDAFRITDFSTGEPPVTAVFRLRRASNANVQCYLCHYAEQTAQQTFELSVIWDAMALVWHHPKATITHWRFLSALSGGSKTVNERSWAPQSADTTVGEWHRAPLGANSGGGRTEVLKCSNLPPSSAGEISVLHGARSSVINCR